MTEAMLHPDRLFPSNPVERDIARHLYSGVRDLPIVSPHGHTDPAWFSENRAFGNPTELLIIPDHYVFRMLYSQGISLEKLGLIDKAGSSQPADPEQVWQLFASHYHLFQGTPSRIWLDHVFFEIFGLTEPLSAATADRYYETIRDKLATPEFRPRALFERFNIEVLATTESPLDDLGHHAQIQSGDWTGNVITTFRPDPVTDPEFENFAANLDELAALTGEDTRHYSGYLDALRQRREFFRQHGATATDHGHPTAATADLTAKEAASLFAVVRAGNCSIDEAELFRAQMLTEMAAMSLEDHLVMQIHPGSYRNHNQTLYTRFGRDMGADIPTRTDYVNGLRPLLNRFGNEPDLAIILFTLDETTYSRELAPLAGHYPCLTLGPAWWFYDSPEGMRRYRHSTMETAGFHNTAGFNDDTRAFLSIPARHDMARRIDCGVLANLVAEHRLNEAEAETLASQLAYSLAKQAYRIP